MHRTLIQSGFEGWGVRFGTPGKADDGKASHRDEKKDCLHNRRFCAAASKRRRANVILFPGFRSLADHGEILRRILLKLRPAALAAQVHFGALRLEDIRFTHLAQLFAGHDTGGQWILAGQGERQG